MYEFAPPGRGYAYGETIPIFIKELVARSLLLRASGADSATGALYGVAHHRAPLLPRGPVEVLAEGPLAPVRFRLFCPEGGAELVRGGAGKLGPAGPHERSMVRIARSRLRDPKDVSVEPRRS